MLTGFATTADAEGAGLVPVGAAAGPHATATPTAASAWRNRLRSTFTPASLSISCPPREFRARLYLRCDPQPPRAQSGAARAAAAAAPLEDVRAGSDRTRRRHAGAGAHRPVHRAVDAPRRLPPRRARGAHHGTTRGPHRADARDRSSRHRARRTRN